MLEESHQQIAWMKKELKKNTQEIIEVKIELKKTLEVLEEASGREVENQLKLRQAERIISQKERTIEEQKSIMQNQDILIHEQKYKNQILSDQNLCKICCSEQIQVLYSPCGHLYSCQNCASKIRKCPVCRKRIEKLESAFLP